MFSSAKRPLSGLQRNTGIWEGRRSWGPGCATQRKEVGNLCYCQLCPFQYLLDSPAGRSRPQQGVKQLIHSLLARFFSIGPYNPPISLLFFYSLCTWSSFTHFICNRLLVLKFWGGHKLHVAFQRGREPQYFSRVSYIKMWLSFQKRFNAKQYSSKAYSIDMHHISDSNSFYLTCSFKSTYIFWKNMIFHFRIVSSSTDLHNQKCNNS